MSSSGSPARDDDSSASTYHADGADSGSTTPGMWRVVSSTPTRGISSKEVTLSLLTWRSRSSNDTAAAGSRMAMNAVARDRIAGNNLMHAAVMTPSVPSAPRNSDLMS